MKSLVLVAPAAIRQPRDEGDAPLRLVLYAHPERVGPQAELTPEDLEKQRTLVGRIMGPARDEALESQMPELNVPVLVIFGTKDEFLPSHLARL